MHGQKTFDAYEICQRKFGHVKAGLSLKKSVLFTAENKTFGNCFSFEGERPLKMLTISVPDVSFVLSCSSHMLLFSQNPTTNSSFRVSAKFCCHQSGINLVRIEYHFFL